MIPKFYDCITEFLFVEDEPEPADLLFLPGGNYPETALYAAQLYREGYAPLLLPSGRYSIRKNHFEPEQKGQGTFETEYDYFRWILLKEGVPESAILKEDRAAYTYENALFSKACVSRLGLTVRQAILCCQAFHARRCLMYYQEQFPETRFLVCPVVTKGISRTGWYRSEQGIDTVLGELERCGGQFHAIMREYLQEKKEN